MLVFLSFLKLQLKHLLAQLGQVLKAQDGLTWLFSLVGILGLICSVSGLVSLAVVFSQSSTQSCPIPLTESLPQEVETIKVEVSGAVVKPGVYQVGTEERVGEAIAQAGGFSSEADASWIAQNLNLASPLEDSQKIFIPLQSSQSHQLPSAPDEGLLSVNTATQAELEELPGIGAKRAQAIIENRPFLKIDELITKEVVTEAIFVELRNLIKI
jgi:competence protein ComEA